MYFYFIYFKETLVFDIQGHPVQQIFDYISNLQSKEK